MHVERRRDVKCSGRIKPSNLSWLEPLNFWSGRMRPVIPALLFVGRVPFFSLKKKKIHFIVKQLSGRSGTSFTQFPASVSSCILTVHPKQNQGSEGGIM